MTGVYKFRKLFPHPLLFKGAGIFAIGLLIIVLALFQLEIIAPFGPNPSRYPIRGVDVSHHQAEIDWSEFANQGIRFAFIKATEGGDFRDERFVSNWHGSRQAAIVPGAYHVFSYCRQGDEQAQNFISIVPNETGTLPPAIDISSGAACRSRFEPQELAKEFEILRSLVEKHYGRPPILYPSSFSTLYVASADKSSSKLWARGLLISPAFQYGDDWSFWQYAIRGRLRGVSTYVDMNAFNGGESDFSQLVYSTN